MILYDADVSIITASERLLRHNYIQHLCKPSSINYLVTSIVDVAHTKPLILDTLNQIFYSFSSCRLIPRLCRFLKLCYRTNQRLHVDEFLL
jgi:hypothetical protein